MIEHDRPEFGNIPASRSKTIWIDTLGYMRLQISQKGNYRPQIIYRLIEHWKNLLEDFDAAGMLSLCVQRIFSKKWIIVS